MKVFVSFADEQARIADTLATALHAQGHDVLIDSGTLPPGEAHRDVLRASVDRADIFVFLISPQSVKSRSRAMDQLAVAHDRWPNPSGHVLPVVVEPTRIETLPAYLGAVTVLRPQGDDPVPATLARLSQLQARLDRDVAATRNLAAQQAAIGRRRRLRRVGGAVVVVAAGTVGLSAWQRWHAPTGVECRLDARIESSSGSAASAAITALAATLQPQGPRREFAVAGGRATIDLGPMRSASQRWTVEAMSAGSRVGEAWRLAGCPDEAIEWRDDVPGLALRLAPRPGS